MTSLSDLRVCVAWMVYGLVKRYSPSQLYSHTLTVAKRPQTRNFCCSIQLARATGSTCRTWPFGKSPEQAARTLLPSHRR